MESDVLYGVLFSLAGNISISIGDHLKIYGRSQNTKTLTHRKSKIGNRRCTRDLLFTVLGYSVMMFGQGCNGYALAYAPQTLLACMGSVQFIVKLNVSELLARTFITACVSNSLLCSAALQNSRIKVVHWFGTIAIITGCLIMVFGFSPKNDEDLTVIQLFYNYNTWQYRYYLVLVVVIFSVSLFWQYLNCIPNIKKDLPMNVSNSRCDPSYLAAFFYSFSSAMTGTQSVVLGKSVAIIVRRYSGGHIQFFDPAVDMFTIMFVAVTVISYCTTFAFWMYRRTESMVLFDHVFIAPLNQVMWLTFSTIAGGIYFKEFESAHTLQWIALVCGMSLNYIGLAYLVPNSGDRPHLEINMELPRYKRIKRKKKKKMDDTSAAAVVLHRSKIDSYSNPNFNPCHSQISSFNKYSTSHSYSPSTDNNTMNNSNVIDIDSDSRSDSDDEYSDDDSYSFDNLQITQKEKQIFSFKHMQNATQESVPLISLSSGVVRNDALSITDRIALIVKSIYGKHG